MVGETLVAIFYIFYETQPSGTEQRGGSPDQNGGEAFEPAVEHQIWATPITLCPDTSKKKKLSNAMFWKIRNLHQQHPVSLIQLICVVP